ncbi:MAG: sulfite exporter TauE/SafE family protein [Magnetococcus sp. DMHC-6]
MNWPFIWIIITLGALVQGCIGIGLSLVAVPFLVLSHPELVPVPLMLAAFPLTLLTWFRERKAVHFPDMGWAVLGRVVGSAVGAWILIQLPKAWLEPTFGGMILLACGMSLLGPRFTPNRVNLVMAGVASGIMGTTIATGGPAMALVFQHIEGPRLRASMAVFLSLGILPSILFLWLAGRLGTEEIVTGVWIIPAVLCGFLLSTHVKPILDKYQMIRPIILIICCAGGLALLRQTVLNVIFE